MKTNAWLAVGILVFAGYFLWLLFFINRYQALCQSSLLGSDLFTNKLLQRSEIRVGQ